MTFVCLVCRVFGSSASSEAIDGSGGAPGGAGKTVFRLFLHV